MNYIRKSLTNVLAAIFGVIAIATIAIWQFYLFATFTDSMGVVDMQGGILHLWLSIGIGLFACIAGFFLFSYFLRYDKENELHITS
jgi:hypothetical protein